MVQGFGYWSGCDVQVEFRPAPVGTGVVFVRDDLQPGEPIAAAVDRRIEVPRRTTLAHGGSRVEMVEHILAALSGLQIDNCAVHVSAAEMPGMDGSAFPFVEALQAAGAVEQAALRSKLVIGQVTRLGNDDSWIEARPSPHDHLRLTYRLDYGSHNAIGRQAYSGIVSRGMFSRELASCRTFMFKHEAAWLLSQGLGRRVTPRDLLVFGDDGPIENKLRFADECVRHKVLDLVGDLALAGCDVVGDVVAHRSGHRLNAELVRVLLAEGEIVDDLRRCA